ncbi:hypothetical protein CcaverHIS002_0600870 [Cutaneotrichosporon cavernicola]|uniref:F-box domain-containing protein n=1 Tax=Cutaneotrichosporon cavernicola TaxID=279322 RepID=A0AA48L5Q4_9TREE|nr:uncharacterized protein CcaverHIS019_0500970 [Cutaneotrichosporon cavernicola]BEI85800.1 hypothetical protein CcaverHIS002_0600870 [Cutaneotrichosporon cavernicola]BEI92469.1 hypothetical protein CcaverHIS019_0500970 [Cutaneotrichosporon cavernicola]BEJ00241.1 hypothetical protein CcaverHIS631_0500980 [Cutaneotrichosporon cavernicola]BEJ08012.1 hypothetical protein CcaverHIS641_0500970 [Cutaneotrichosporon cavernicola]
MPDGTAPLPVAIAGLFDKCPVTVLDHLAFPHLLEAVLDSASPSSLLALRTACRALKNAADSRLAHHIVLVDALRTPDLLLRIPPTLFAHTRILELRALKTEHQHAGIACTGCGVRRRDAAMKALQDAMPLFTGLHVVRVGDLGCDWAEAAQFKRLRTAWVVYDAADPLPVNAENVVLNRTVGKALYGLKGHVYLYPPCVDVLADLLDTVADTVFARRQSATFTLVDAERYGLSPGCVRQVLSRRGGQNARVDLVRFLSVSEFGAVAGEEVLRLL